MRLLSDLDGDEDTGSEMTGVLRRVLLKGQRRAGKKQIAFLDIKFPNACILCYCSPSHLRLRSHSSFRETGITNLIDVVFISSPARRLGSDNKHPYSVTCQPSRVCAHQRIMSPMQAFAGTFIPTNISCCCPCPGLSETWTTKGGISNFDLPKCSRWLRPWSFRPLSLVLARAVTPVQVLADIPIPYCS
jgi:hypothetical protein